MIPPDPIRPDVSQQGPEQSAPIINDGPCVQDLVIADVLARKEVGRQRYGTVLQPFNGRDALRDAYEEALDLCQYLKQAMLERAALASASASPHPELLRFIERECRQISVNNGWGQGHAKGLADKILEAMQAASASPGSGEGWQLIETVPRKGPVLVTNGSRQWIAPNPLMSKGRGAATHWQHLPLPPSALPASEGQDTI